MKRYIYVLMLVSVVFSGCGKKKVAIGKKNSAMVNNLSRSKGNIDEYVFDDGSKVEDFAFAEEDKKGKSAYNSDAAISDDLLKDEVDSLVFNDEDEFEKVNFQFDSDRLTSGQQEKLHKNIEKARQLASKDKAIDVRAYGCEIGSPAYNLALSQKRANAIKKEMIAHGVSSKKINAVGRGQEYQIAWSNASDRTTRIKELSPNRRAEISAYPAN